MKYLRFLAIALFSFLISPALTSCGDDEPTPEEKPVDINNLTFTGTTISFPVTGDDSHPDFSTTVSVYTVRLNHSTHTCTIEIEHPKFISNMPDNLGTMVFDNVPFTYTDGHGYEFSVRQLIPKIADTPYPAFQITDLEGDFDGTGTLDVEFTCARFSRTVEFEGTVKR